MLLEWLPDKEKINSDGMMNTNTNIKFPFFLSYIIFINWYDETKKKIKKRNVSVCIHHIIKILSGHFQGSKIQHGIFWELIFGPGIFKFLLEAQGIFLGFDFAPIRSCPTLEIRYPPPPLGAKRLQKCKRCMVSWPGHWLWKRFRHWQRQSIATERFWNRGRPR